MSTVPISRNRIAEQLEEEGKLCRFIPRLRGSEQAIRRISLSPRISKWLNESGNITLKSGVRSHFSVFVKGDDVDDLHYMKRVEYRSVSYNGFDDQIWSVRPTALPYQRFFGAFLSPDWLIILNMRARDELKYNDELWNRQIEKTRSAWTSIFSGIPCHAGTCFEDYVKFKSEHLDDRWDES